MRSMRIPTFITDVTDDRAGLRALIAACAAIAAAGLDPKVLDPGMPDVRAALRAAPDLQSLVLVGVVVASAFLIVGGVLGDMLRSARLLRMGLALFVLSSVLGVALPSGPGLVLGRAVAWVAAGLVIPYAVGSVARTYDGATRATALGVVYAVMGAASAAAPALALALGVDGPRWPAFVACGVMSVIAILVSRGRTPDLPGADRSQRPWQAVTGLWAFGVVALVAAILSIGRLDLVRIGVGGIGVCVIVVAVWLQRRLARDVAGVPVNLRALVVVLAVGMVVGFVQVAPTLQLPMFFQFVEGFSPLLATVAIAPFVVALLLAGPISGMLLARFQPRVLIAMGLIAIGLANLSVSLVIARGAPYLVFVVPFVLVGAGFVIATTVRTAVIFASVPRGLPATAAALNEASLSVGSRLGITVVSLVVVTAAIDAFRGGMTGLAPDAIERAATDFRQILELIGMPGFIQMVHGIDEAIRPDYDDAIVQGLRASHLLAGLVALGAGAIAFVALGRRAPVRSVWDYADEREPAPGSVSDGIGGTPERGTGVSGPADPDDPTAAR